MPTTFTSFMNLLAVVLSLSTTTGILVHETRIDKMAAVSTILPVATGSGKAEAGPMSFSTEAHTSFERGPLSQAVHELKSPSPSIQPRSNEDRKHLMQKHVTRGHHAFDNYSLPVVE